MVFRIQTIFSVLESNGGWGSSNDQLYLHFNYQCHLAPQHLQVQRNKPTFTTEESIQNRYLAPFATDAPSEALFQRKDGLAALAPIINVASNLLTKPIPTNKWWGNLIHTTTEDIDTVANPAWSNPYALKLPKEAPFGIQACYSYTYRQMAGEVNGVVRYYLHEFHNDVTLSANEFGSTKPDYEVYSFSEMGVSVRTCVTGSKNCMDSALVHGMAFVSATYAGLTPRIESEYAMTLQDSSTPGKYVVKLTNQQTWVIFASDTGASFHITGSALVSNAVYTGTLRMAILPETGDESVYDDNASCVVRGGDVSVQSRTSYLLDWETEGSSCDSTGLLHFALPHQVEVMKEAITTKSKGAIVLHSSTRGDMVAQVTKSGSWILTEDEADEEVDFYPSTKPSADVVAQVNLLSTLQSDIDSDWVLDKGMADGKDQESTSEDVNFYYGMKLWGQVSGNKAVEDIGSLMLRLDARTVRTYFLMTSDNTIHPPQFVPNHVTGIFFDNKADYTTWFSAEKYRIHGIQMIPVSPINGLARTKTFIQEEWDDILSKEPIVTGSITSNAWLSLLLVNEAVINQADALAKLATATMDDGLTRSWLCPMPHLIKPQPTFGVEGEISL
ncbi:hypothetical protein PInf_012916 [Phytophthora infestans]|nr:hypothetical protein PInf_012916 [Phytophthora infestans]